MMRTCVLALALAALVGCSGGSSAVAEKETPKPPANPNGKAVEGKVDSKPTATGVVMKADGFTLTMPKGWTEINPSKGDLKEVIGKAFPGDQVMVKNVEQMLDSGNFKLFAFAPLVKGSKFRDNLNVNLIEAPGATTQMAYDANKAQFGKMGAVISSSYKEGDAYAKIEVQLKGQQYRTFSYQAVQDGKLYVFTFSSATDRAAAMSKVADAAMETLTFP